MGLGNEIQKVFVTCEKLLAKLKAEYPNLHHTVHSSAIGAFTGATIYGASAAAKRLTDVAAAAKKHDAQGDKHDVHRA